MMDDDVLLLPSARTYIGNDRNDGGENCSRKLKLKKYILEVRAADF